MSNRPGTPGVTLIASGALAIAAGRTIALNNGASALIDAVSILYTPTATVGNRAPTIRVLDSGGNILWQCAVSAAVVATNPVRIVAGAGATPQSLATPLMQMLTLPSELAVPAQSPGAGQAGTPGGASIQIFDAANVDVNDTVSGNISFAM